MDEDSVLPLVGCDGLNLARKHSPEQSRLSRIDPNERKKRDWMAVNRRISEKTYAKQGQETHPKPSAPLTLDGKELFLLLGQCCFVDGAGRTSVVFE